MMAAHDLRDTRGHPAAGSPTNLRAGERSKKIRQSQLASSAMPQRAIARGVLIGTGTTQCDGRVLVLPLKAGRRLPDIVQPRPEHDQRPGMALIGGEPLHNYPVLIRSQVPIPQHPSVYAIVGHPVYTPHRPLRDGHHVALDDEPFGAPQNRYAGPGYQQATGHITP